MMVFSKKENTMATLTAKQQHWLEQLSLAEAYDGSLAEYAREQNIPIQALYSWRNHFKRAAVSKEKPTQLFTPVVSTSSPDFAVTLQLGHSQLQFTRLPNPQWLVEFIALSHSA
jgi:hypothetical protein